MPSSMHSQKYITFREMLVSTRFDLGVTQVELAKLLKKPQSYVSKYERGERRLDFTEFVDVAIALNVDLELFVNDYLRRTKSV